MFFFVCLFAFVYGFLFLSSCSRLFRMGIAIAVLPVFLPASAPGKYLIFALKSICFHDSVIHCLLTPTSITPSDRLPAPSAQYAQPALIVYFYIPIPRGLPHPESPVSRNPAYPLHFPQSHPTQSHSRPQIPTPDPARRYPHHLCLLLAARFWWLSLLSASSLFQDLLRTFSHQHPPVLICAPNVRN